VAPGALARMSASEPMALIVPATVSTATASARGWAGFIVMTVCAVITRSAGMATPHRLLMRRSYSRYQDGRSAPGSVADESGAGHTQ